MPTIDNNDATTGRVTRSLRKRLTSVDSEAPSRPGTPVVSSLPTLQETATPSKRITRRTSISTPIAVTPSKGRSRFDTPDVTNSPARRVGKRKSLSILEHEDPVVKPKDPTFDSVKEEQSNEKTPQTRSRRLTRSSPKSIQEEESKLESMSSSGRKSPDSTNQVCTNLQDSGGEAQKSPKPKKQTKVMIKKEKNIDEMVVKQVNFPKQIEGRNSEQSKNLSIGKNSNPEEQSISSKVSSEEQSPSKTAQPEESISVKSPQPSPIKSSQLETSTETTKFDDLKTIGKSQGSTLTASGEYHPNTSTEGNVGSQKSPQPKKTRPEKLKNVAFDETFDDDVEKNVFPKTPGLTKSKSYILDDSTEKNSSGQSAEMNKSSQAEEGKNAEEEDNEVLSTKTPYKLKVNAVESSTPIHCASPKKKKDSSKVEEQVENESMKESNQDSSRSFPRSWSHSVSGNVESMGKIDVIESEETSRKKLEEQEALKSQTSASKKNSRIIIDDSSDEEDNNEYEEGRESSAENEEEDQDREKIEFIDDEAMEAVDGEDSMDSEERAYLEENEVPAYGESLGSEDSDVEEEREECEEEEIDEEDAAFIVSDTEMISQEEFSSGEEVISIPKNKQKKYKRIMKASESSNDEYIKTEKSDEMCLQVESSVEEEREQDNVVCVEDLKLDTENLLEDQGYKPNAQADENEEKHYSRKSFNAQDDLYASQKESKSLSRSKRDRSMQENKEGEEDFTAAEEEFEANTSRRSLKFSQMHWEENEIVDELEEQAVGKKKSRKSRLSEPLSAESPYKKSLNEFNDNVDSSPREKDTSRRSLKDKRKSVKRREEVQEYFNPEEDVEMLSEHDGEQESPRKSLKRERKKSLNKSKQAQATSDLENQVDDGEEEPSRRSLKADRRKSLNKSKQAQDNSDIENQSVDEGELESSRRSLKAAKRKSVNKSQQAQDNSDLENQSVEEGELEPSRRSLKAEKRKSLNKSKKAQDNSDIENQSVEEGELESSRRSVKAAKRKSVNKSQQAQDNSDLENQSVEEGKLESSRKSLKAEKRKSLNKSKQAQDHSDFENQSVDEAEHESSRRSLKAAKRKSVNKSQQAQDNSDLENRSVEEGELESSIRSLKAAKRKSLNKSKQAQDYSDFENQSVDEAEHESSRRSLKAAKRKSVNKSQQAQDNSDLENQSVEEDELESSRESLKAAKRKSLNKSKQAQDHSDFENQSVDEAEHESSTRSLKAQRSLNRSKQAQEKSDIENQSVEEGELEPSRRSLKAEKRKSLNKSNLAGDNSDFENQAVDDGEQEPSRRSLKSDRRKSLNKSKQAQDYSQFENEDVGGAELESSRSSLKAGKRKSLNKSKLAQDNLELESQNDDSEHNEYPDEGIEESRKSLNVSKKQLNKSENRNCLSSVRIEEGTDEQNLQAELNRSMKSNNWIEDNQDHHPSAEDRDDKCSDEEMEEEQKVAVERSTIMEFLGEEEENSSRPSAQKRKVKSLNGSNLDQTFDLESDNNAAQEKLLRTIARKSLNQSQKQNIKETEPSESSADCVQGNLSFYSSSSEKAISEHEDKDQNSNVSQDNRKTEYSGSSAEIDAEICSIVNELSGETARTECEDNLFGFGDKQEHGGDVRSNDSSEENSAESEDEYDRMCSNPLVKKISTDQGLSVSLSSIESKNKKKVRGANTGIHNSFTIGVTVRQTSEDRLPSSKFIGSAELNSNEEVENPNPRKSLATSKSVDSYDQKQSRYTQDAEEEPKQGKKLKSQSNSFCGVTPNENEAHKEETKSERGVKKEEDTRSKFEHLLTRCDEILEEANLAKREAKLNARKSKVKKPKWMQKEEKVSKEGEEVKIPLVSRKELKRKEKMRQEVLKAMKRSSALLSTEEPKTKKQKNPLKSEIKEISEEICPTNSSKRLPPEFLEVIQTASRPLQQKRKKSKEIVNTPPSDKENSKKASNKRTFSETITSNIEKKKKKKEREILETATGTIVVEPVTPVKLRYQNGFRESPKTPVGFKVDDLRDKETAKKRGRKLFTASGEFIEEDLSLSRASSKKAHKRSREIDEPTYCLPKTQWTASGMFIEEDLRTGRPLANSTATQFMVSSINSNGKKSKNSSKIVSSSTLSSALSFKQNAMFSNKVQRESSRNVLLNKQRKFANHKY